MMTEEQIQRLAKKLSDEHGDDEEECKKHVLFTLSGLKIAHAFVSEDKKELFKKAYEGEFLEDLIQESFILRKQIDKISCMCRDREAYEGEFLEDLIQKGFILRKQIDKIYCMCLDRVSSLN